MAIGAFIVGATVAAYVPVFQNGFVNIDDPGYVTENIHIARGVSVQSLRWALTTTRQANWHPVTWVSHMLDVQSFGMNPVGHHATSVVIHVLNAVLLFILLRRLTGSEFPSALVSLLFAVHPLHVESVAWVSERKDVLSAFFFLLTLLAYARYSETRRAVVYVVAIGLFAVGLMCKPMLVTLPLVLLLFDIWPLQRVRSEPWFRLVVEKIPFLLLSALSSGITLYAQNRGGALVGFESLALGRRLANAAVALVTYLQRAVWPTRLSAFYPYPGEIPVWNWLGSLVALSVITAVAVRQGSRRPYLLVGWLWYLVTMVPVIGLIQVGSQPTADRYTYIPLVGPFVMVAWGCAEVARTFSVGPLVTGGLAASVLAPLVVLTWSQVSYWQDGIALWTHAVAIAPDSATAHNYLGEAFSRSGQVPIAIEHYRRALALRPDLSDAHNNLGVGLESLDRLDEAMREYEAAILANPASAEAHNNRGAALARKGELQSAIEEFRITTRLKPEFVPAYTNLGGALLQSGAVDEATRAFESALGIDASDPDANVNYANALLEHGQTDLAVGHYQTALKARPHDAAALNGLGSAQMDLGKPDLAIATLREAVTIAPSFAEGRNNLCRALAAARLFGDAVTQCEMAVTLRGSDTGFRYDLALSLLNLKRTDDAIHQLRLILEIDPSHSAARRVLADLSKQRD